ncbi:MAG: hypothetical protein ACYTGL_00625 [Planctomycetota bacterium]|jgi:hypothetical protein
MLALIVATFALSAAAALQLMAVDTDAVSQPAADSAASQSVENPEYKQVAVSILTQAQDALASGDVKEARRLASDAARIQAHWTAGELTPAQFLSQLPDADDSQPRKQSATGSNLHSPEYARLARDLLREARDYLSQGDLDQAEELAAAAGRLDIEWWKGEQTPADLIARIRKAKQFHSSPQVPGRGQRTQGFVYVAGEEQRGEAAPTVLESVPESSATGRWIPASEGSASQETPGGHEEQFVPQLILPEPDASIPAASLSETAAETSSVSPVGFLENDQWSEVVVTADTQKNNSVAAGSAPYEDVFDTPSSPAATPTKDISVFKVAVSELSSAVRELRESVQESQLRAADDQDDQNRDATASHTGGQQAPSAPVAQHWPSTVAPVAPQAPGFMGGQMMSPYPPIIIQNYPSMGGGPPVQWQASYYVPSVPAPGAPPAMPAPPAASQPTPPATAQPTASASGSWFPWLLCGLLLIGVVLFGRQIDEARIAAVEWVRSRSESDQSARSARNRSRASDDDDDSYEEQNPRAMILSVLDQNMELREKLSA